jgi:hypothetical protein
MAVNHTYIPYNPQFDMDAYIDYRNKVDAYRNFIWTADAMDYLRLPGNVGIWDLLIYVGMCLDDWLPQIGYSGENVLYSPSYPDIIYSLHGNSGSTQDSPHMKVPPIISYRVVRREPDSHGTSPFNGKNKMWKFRNCGDYTAPDGRIYRVRYKSWENKVNFSCVHRSGTEAEALCVGFEQFMDLNERKFMEAGMNKMATLGREQEPNITLQAAGVHYRETQLWFRTQEFQFAGPFANISDVDIDVAVQS